MIVMLPLSGEKMKIKRFTWNTDNYIYIYTHTHTHTHIHIIQYHNPENPQSQFSPPWKPQILPCHSRHYLN